MPSLGSYAHLQERRVLQQRGDIELLPHAALRVAVLRAQPRRRLADALRRQLLERAHAEPRRQPRARLRALQPLRQRELILAQRNPTGDLGKTHPRAEILARSSACLIGFTM